MNHYELAVIGGGASGMAAAVAASSAGDRVVIFEAGDALGRKIAASGNGRCNLMNTGQPVYYGNTGFARKVLKHCGISEQKRFWHDIGLLLSEADEQFRVYPCTYQSISVIHALKTALKIKNVRILLNSPVDKCEKNIDGSFGICAGECNISADRVLIATGSCAGLQKPAAEKGYSLLEKFGHTINPLKPALVPLLGDRKSISGLAGIRIRCIVTLMDPDGGILHTEKGELLFTEYGISGICVMQCARFLTEGCRIELNLVDMIFKSDTDFCKELEDRRNRFSAMPPDALLNGILPARLSYAVMKQAGIPMKGECIGNLDDEAFRSILRVSKKYRIDIIAAKGIEFAQVCAGGAECEQFCSESMESRIIPGLFAAGEALDIDGDCGGFNLMFAFGSGILAGVNRRISAYVNS